MNGIELNQLLKIKKKKIPVSLDTRKSLIMEKGIKLELNLLMIFQD